MKIAECSSIEEVRANIDRIDSRIVALLAERGGYVKQAAKFKKTTDDVKAPQRVGQVIAKVTALSKELGADPIVTEQVYRTLISSFVSAELAEHAATQKLDRPTPNNAYMGLGSGAFFPWLLKASVMPNRS